jgi:hypothetical protein
MSTIHELALAIRERNRERQQAYVEEQRGTMSEEERQALADKIFAELYPPQDWHDDKPEHAYEDVPSQTELQEARHGITANPWTWRLP